MPRTCLRCGAEILDRKHPNKKYCSRDCAWPDTAVTTICEWCGKPFTFSGFRGSTQRFCSKKCFAASQSTRAECVCVICGGAFTPKSTHHSTTYCSRKCADISRRKPENYPEYVCLQCGKTFHRHIAQARPSFCSKACLSDWLSNTTTGENHPRWKGGIGANRGRNWPKQRQLALKRDKNRCVLCGTTVKLCVHHIRPYREFNGDYLAANDLTNLITLCYWCHPKAENGLISIQYRMF